MRRRSLHYNSIVILLQLVVALRYEWPDHSTILCDRWVYACRNDLLNFCPSCFDQSADSACAELQIGLRIPLTLVAFAQLLHIDRRRVQLAEFFNTLAYVKHIGPTNRTVGAALQRILSAPCTDNPSWPQDTAARLLEYYASTERADGMRILPVSSLLRFLRVFAAFAQRHNDADVVMPALWLNANGSPLLLFTLYPLGFAVPRILWQNGLLMVQSYAGRPMSEYYAASFAVRGRIARNLLRSVQQFTDGVDGFRIYLTDATADNIMVRENDYTVSIVDLDNVIVVDSRTVQNASIEKHHHIHCDGCFAYDANGMANHWMSDFNVYAICSLLSSDLYGVTANGFLHSVPPDLVIRGFVSILDACVICDNSCSNRMNVADRIIKMLEES